MNDKPNDYLQAMIDEASRYRERAAYFRELAKTARDDATLTALLNMADDFEEEAAKLEEAIRDTKIQIRPTPQQ